MINVYSSGPRRGPHTHIADIAQVKLFQNFFWSNRSFSFFLDVTTHDRRCGYRRSRGKKIQICGSTWIVGSCMGLKEIGKADNLFSCMLLQFCTNVMKNVTTPMLQRKLVV